MQINTRAFFLSEEVSVYSSKLPRLLTAKTQVPSRTFAVVVLAAAQHHRHEERVAARLQVADHRHAPETPVHQHHPHADAQQAQPPEQAPQDILHLLAALDQGQRQGVALAAIVDVGGGVGVEVAGPALGLRAVDLQLGVQRQPVVRDQDQVDGHWLGPAE